MPPKKRPAPRKPATEYRKLVGAEIRSYREIAGLTQADVARKMTDAGRKTSRRSVADWEKGEVAAPSIDDLPFLADALDCLVSDFFPENFSEKI